jgi:hypothetical protein
MNLSKGHAAQLDGPAIDEKLPAMPDHPKAAKVNGL